MNWVSLDNVRVVEMPAGCLVEVGGGLCFMPHTRIQSGKLVPAPVTAGLNVSAAAGPDWVGNAGDKLDQQLRAKNLLIGLNKFIRGDMEDNTDNQAVGRAAGAARRPLKKSWQVYDGAACGTVITLRNRIVGAPPEFKRYMGQLLATLPRRMKVAASEGSYTDGRHDAKSAG